MIRTNTTLRLTKPISSNGQRQRPQQQIDHALVIILTITGRYVLCSNVIKSPFREGCQWCNIWENNIKKHYC
ncbi:hypothetical protein BLOT_001169 [Blomia tropicalis]|nr:hypothetical protein BLOT_001169 [Blomia tropicalis]